MLGSLPGKPKQASNFRPVFHQAHSSFHDMKSGYAGAVPFPPILRNFFSHREN
jgi:hypothetical protein